MCILHVTILFSCWTIKVPLTLGSEAKDLHKIMVSEVFEGQCEGKERMDRIKKKVSNTVTQVFCAA